MSKATYDFSDATVVVTGASSGIGRAIAFAFADAGATVFNASRRPEAKDADVPTHEAIRDRGGTARYLPVDVADPAELEATIEAAREFGGVDVMVNNAGIYVDSPLLETTPAELDALYEANVRGVLFGTQAAAKDMIERGVAGSVVNLASISSNLSQFGHVPYDATKGAVRMLTRGAALELAEYGIRVNATAPGQIATEILEGWSEEAVRGAEADDFLKPVPLGRAGFPEDVARATLFLASDDASYVTGELLHVDGGWQIC
ncbi:MAG: SDR family NAD(P)-dependent oxidoreductase [Salinigranum sp.]